MIANGHGIPEDPDRLVSIDTAGRVDYDFVVGSLRRDLVVLIRNVGAEQADDVVAEVAERFGLRESLELQAGLASMGHRVRVGRYFMTVNRRAEYQIVTPHSEGSSFVSMQLASFFCYENSTDGGETILMNVDEAADAWQSLRERVRRARLARRPLARNEIARAKWRYQLDLPSDELREDDRVVSQEASEIPGLTVVDVLARPRKRRSRILEREMHAYWDSIDGADFDSLLHYGRWLREWGLLKEPPGGVDVHRLDSDAERRIWHSGADYGRLFRCRISRKLASGDLVLQNNMTWTHAVANWSPRSGSRRVVAAFA
jgi:hypothetical protein